MRFSGRDSQLTPTSQCTLRNLYGTPSVFGFLFAVSHRRNQQPSKQPPNDFGLSAFERPIQTNLFIIFGAGRGGRTPTTLRSADFESAASASSAIPASDEAVVQVSHILRLGRHR